MAGVTFFTEDGLDLSHVVDGRSIRDQFSWRIRMGSGDHKPTECGGERVRQKIDAVHFGDSLEGRGSHHHNFRMAIMPLWVRRSCQLYQKLLAVRVGQSASNHFSSVSADSVSADSVSADSVSAPA